MPLFTQPPIQWALYEGDPGAGAQVALTANTAYFIPVYCMGQGTITAMHWRTSGSPSGQTDAGIYDAQGNLMGHTGQVTNVAGEQTANLISNVQVSQGRYYVALQCSAADLYAESGQLAGLSLSSSVAATGGLPSTQSGSADSGKKPYVLGIISGGYS